MDKAATKQEWVKASNKTNVVEPSLCSTQNKSEFETAYLFGAELFLSGIVVLEEFANFEQYHPFIVVNSFGLHTPFTSTALPSTRKKIM